MGNTPVIVNDQVGLSRATTGCVIASLFKEFQISASFEGLVETVPGVNASLLKTDRYVMDMSKDALFRGEFEVVKELVAKMKDGAGAKNNADKIIDLNGTKKTGGTGIKQLRENIPSPSSATRSWMTLPRPSSSPRLWTTSISTSTSLSS